MTYDFEANRKIGKKAENIVKKLFREAGYQVFEYGSEYTCEELVNYLRENKIEGEATEFVRHQPDFVVVNNKNKAYFVEVKFRKNGKIKISQMFDYPCCYVVFMNTDYIYGQNLDKIKKSGETKFMKINHLEPFWDISDELLEKYQEMVRRILGDENYFGQKLSKVFTDITKKKIYKERNETCVVVSE